MCAATPASTAPRTLHCTWHRTFPPSPRAPEPGCLGRSGDGALVPKACPAPWSLMRPAQALEDGHHGVTAWHQQDSSGPPTWQTRPLGTALVLGPQGRVSARSLLSCPGQEPHAGSSPLLRTIKQPSPRRLTRHHSLRNRGGHLPVTWGTGWCRGEGVLSPTPRAQPCPLGPRDSASPWTMETPSLSPGHREAPSSPLDHRDPQPLPWSRVRPLSSALGPRDP